MRSNKRKTKSSSRCEKSPVPTKNMADVSKVLLSDQLDAISKRLDGMLNVAKMYRSIRFFSHGHERACIKNRKRKL